MSTNKKSKKPAKKVNLCLIFAIIFGLFALAELFLLIFLPNPLTKNLSNTSLTNDQTAAYLDATDHLVDQFLFNLYQDTLATNSEHPHSEQDPEILDIRFSTGYYKILSYGVTDDNNFYIKFQNFVPKEYIGYPTDKIATVYFWKDAEKGTYSYAYSYEDIKE